MEWLNYHHLHYFWTVVRVGSVRAASEELRVAPSTISGQLKQLDGSLGHALLRRRGRGLEPTDVGRIVYRYADEIFRTGRELLDYVHGRRSGRALELEVGVQSSIPKLMAMRLIQPALDIGTPVRLVCREDKVGPLLSELALRQLDVVLSDRPARGEDHVRAFSHRVASCGVGIYGTPGLVARCARDFPQSLEGLPMIVPTAETALRQQVELWLREHGVKPVIVGEFDDSALLKAFAQQGMGLFAVPELVHDELRERYGFALAGKLADLKAEFFATAIERQVDHPGVQAILAGVAD